MREHDLELLELPAVLARLGAATASEPGSVLADALRPSADAAVVRLRQQQTSEAISLIEDSVEPDLGDATDVSEAAELAGRGSALDTRALMQIGRTIQAGVTARRALAARNDIPALLELVAGIDTSLLSIAEEIGRAVEEDGSDLRDSASPELRRLRRVLRDGRGRLAERLRKIARDPALAEYLQDDFVTERGGRPVLALRASARGRVPGIVHDSSGSGQTLFVEPFAAVDDSNRLREAEIAERDEVTRILRNLSSLVGAQAAALTDLVSATASLDLALACGSLSRSWRGAIVADNAGVVLRGARHPLLDQAAAVPIDLELGELRALVISGPNTGGKTVALKTLGLAAVLHQCGLRPPALEAALPVFDAILVDIGDEQSIAMSLSTFSAHVRNLVGILEDATSTSLVLLDEIAAGTDPVEGAALAEALLDALAGQARLTVTTSHYAELKEWASATDGAANAATGIDPDSYEPLYTVALGRPGTSHALQTAERLGLDGAIVAAARSRVAPERLQVAELVAEAESAAREAQEDLSAAAVERAGGSGCARRGATRRRGAPGRDRAGASVGCRRAPEGPGAGGGRAHRSPGRARGAARRDPCGPKARARAGPGDDSGSAEEGGRARPEARRSHRARRARLTLPVTARRAPSSHRAARGRRSGGRPGHRRSGHDRRARRGRGDRARTRRPAGSRPRRSPSARPPR